MNDDSRDSSGILPGFCFIRKSETRLVQHIFSWVGVSLLKKSKIMIGKTIKFQVKNHSAIVLGYSIGNGTIVVMTNTATVPMNHG